ncbi:MAG: hypothetical protein H7A39_05700 [Chlamydiales bacterium]|nr:hypothetical protein [Chlamydiales bacterium]
MAKWPIATVLKTVYSKLIWGIDSLALAKEERSSASEGDPLGARLRLGAAVPCTISD